MNLNDVLAVGVKHKKRKRIGRGTGSGQGTTAGKGNKGARSRSGFSARAAFEGGGTSFARRLPKRGFTNIFKKHFAVINIEQLNRFEADSVVDVPALCRSGLVKKVLDGVKVLGRGELDRPLTVRAHRFSASARSKIEAAGGKAETLQ